MTRQEYLETIAKLYRVANSSDTEDRPEWLPENACDKHCHGLEILIRDLCDEKEINEFYDETLIETVSDEKTNAYDTWDRNRRTRFPKGDHLHHWDSFEGTEPVASWNPHTGRSWIADN